MANNKWQKRRPILYDPKSEEPFKISRTKLELFIQCPRCFYLDRRFGIGRPDFPSFTLNLAVDTLLKREFDIHRVKNQAHPLMKAYGIEAVPFQHAKLDEWRHNFTGVSYHHPQTNLYIYGAIDDVWTDKGGQLMVVDYKATSTRGEITMDGEYKEGYKRQIEIYQWLMRRNGFNVSDTGYFVYCNGLADKEAFDAKLDFNLQIIPYKGSDKWVEKAIVEAKKSLDKDSLPEADDNCDYCQYRKEAAEKERPSETNYENAQLPF